MLPAVGFDAGSWDPVVRIVPFAAGVFIIIGTAISVIRTMIIPRTMPSALAATVIRSINTIFATVARLRRTYARRDAVLSWAGPIAVMSLLLVWLILFVLGYALILFGISDNTFIVSFVAAGSGLFTLGLIGSPPIDETYISFMAAATGPVVVAMLLGFLPTMYSSYINREAGVTTLSTLSGDPAWGPELLCRIQLLGTEVHRDELFRNWLDWCSQVRLVQSLYPPLNRLRSPSPLRHWLVSMLAVLDAAALTIAMNSKANTAASLALLQQGTQTLSALYDVELNMRERRILFRVRRKIVTTLHLSEQQTRQIRDIPPLPGMPPGVSAVSRAVTADTIRDSTSSRGHEITETELRPITLTRAEFDHGLEVMRSSGVPMDRDADAAWAIFQRERQRYEATAYFLAAAVYAPPAPWSGPRTPATETVWPTLAGSMRPDDQGDADTNATDG